MTEPIGLRGRKKLQTRRRIEAAALELFGRDGFDGTTVEAVAAAADIAPRTFFYYFSAKEDVVLADYAGRLQRIVDQLGQRPDDEPPWEALKASFLVVAADYDSERQEIIRRFRIMAATPSVYARSLQLQAGWEDAVAAALAERMGCQPTDLYPRLLASCALSAVRSSLQHWIATGLESSLPKLVEGC
ncbi:MAG: TetR family transcriptional regulator, partial [Actinobacteria bacterium]|nr:TetR family transcriptional regulator [Actinomycetota bacterium]